MKKLFVLMVALCFTVAQSVYAREEAIYVYLDDEVLDFDVQPTLVNDELLVPMRKTLEALGCEVSWDAATQTAIAVKDGYITLKFTIGSETALVNGKPYTLDSPPILKNGCTLVPLDFIGQALWLNMSWSSSAQIAKIYTAGTARTDEESEYNSSEYEKSLEAGKKIKAKKIYYT